MPTRKASQVPSTPMQRTAINPSGCLAALYDAYRDQIVKFPRKSTQDRQIGASEHPHCQLIRGNTNRDFNILQLIGIEDELIVSLLLQPGGRDGVAKVLEHPRPFDQYTRFLHYTYIKSTEELETNGEPIEKVTGTSKPSMNATHVITGIKYGIHLLVVLHLPSAAEAVNKVDHVLDKIRDNLSKNSTHFSASSYEDINILDKLKDVKVYSNIPSLADLTTVSNILHEINIIPRDIYLCQPVMFFLQPIASLYPPSSLGHIPYNPLSDALKNVIHQYILQTRNSIRRLRILMDKTILDLLGRLPSDQLSQAQNQWLDFKDRFLKQGRHLLKLVVDVRHGRNQSVGAIKEFCRGEETASLRNDIDRVGEIVITWQTKLSSAGNLRTEYTKHSNSHRDSQTTKQNSSNSIPYNAAVYARSNSTPTSSPALQDARILSSEKNNLTRISLTRSATSSFPEKTGYHEHDAHLDDSSFTESPQTSSTVEPPISSSNEIINIVLIGETGVGKSTFINALANYLTFDSFEEAERSEPVVLIPVSFLTTVGDNFEERTVKFGAVDSSNNEDFDHPGRSVTQRCKSYVFDLKDASRKQLRIIDTPGFGDTRGLEQDDQNMEHILQYMNSLTHINAVCFLLKPNASRLHVILRTSFNELFSFLHPDARQNLIFCFTNARSTFYSPGDTAPLLRTMLQSLAITDVPFNKNNTFCFDNESFRFLVALQNDISFNEENLKEYRMSWAKSVVESKRLIDYVDENITVYQVNHRWQSVRQAEFEISYMVRPVLESIRNILRNIILHQMHHSTESIEMSAKHLHYRATRCLSCKSKPVEVGHFWIMPTILHEVRDDCTTCQCSLEQHVSIDYTISHQSWNNTSPVDQRMTNETVEMLCDACVTFAHFLGRTGHSTREDPFLNGLIQMITEEKYICDTEKSNMLNSKLLAELSKVEDQYKYRLDEMKSNSRKIDPLTVYNLSSIINEVPTFREQMTAVRKTQRIIMEKDEHEVQKL